MENVTVDTSDLVAAMRKLDAQADRIARDETSREANDVAGRTRDTVPHRSGRLASSTHASTAGAGANVSMNTPYAGWIEYGGSRGRPYVREGRYLGAASRDADRRLARACESSLQRAARSL